MHDCLTETHLPWGKKYQGKVRDTYDLGERLILITTDRLSAFDRVLAAVPHKGQVLNLMSTWWFEKTKHIVPNHRIAMPDANVTIAKRCHVFPVEFVVRAYATGSTSTSLWTQYKAGVRTYCGHALPEGLKKNEKLAHPILTPTTKDKVHDRLISPNEIVTQALMSKAHFDEASTIALQLFQFAQKISEQHGYILVDTKYEMGFDETGALMLVDELHTPDSSRFWRANSYQEKMNRQEEPESVDKELIRLWFKAHCDPYQDQNLPQAPQTLIHEISKNYVELYETITEDAFITYLGPDPIAKRVEKNIFQYLNGLLSPSII